MQNKNVFITIILLIAVGMACSTQGDNTQNNPSTDNAGDGAAPTPTATLTAPTNTPLPEEESSEFGELPPMTFEEILAVGVDSGNWTEGEGLAQILKYFVGEIPQDSISGVSEVEELAGTGIIRLAGDYLNQPDIDPEIRAEIERLLNIMFPPQEVLDAISRQRSAAPSNELASSQPMLPRQTQAACQDLAGNGYENNASFLDTCYFYEEREIDGNILRIYYPDWWQGDEGREEVVAHTFDAMADGAILYSSFSDLTFKNVNLIFAIAQNGTTNGSQAYFDTENQACPVTMFPRAAESYSIQVYKQIVAHEMFHCVQDWSFPNTAPYGTHKWWLEGTAHYFSNLVYPEANREWTVLNWFDYLSTTEPIFNFTYENFAFFQFMGNKYSPEVLIDILKRVSAAGGQASQERVLAEVQGMDTNFNRFVVEFLSSGIQDSGGMKIKSSNSYSTDQRAIEEKGPVKFTIQPFVAMRFKVDYKQEKRFLQKELTQDEAQFSGVEDKLRGDINSWSDLPPEIRSECKKDVRYLYAITSVKDSYVNYDIDVTLAEKAECDPCLLGTWDVDPESYEAFMERIMEQVDTGGMVIDLKIGGHQYLQFVVEGKIYSQRDDFTITINDQVTTIINGFGSGSYSANGEEMTVSNFLDVTESVGMDIGGGQITYTENSASFSIFGMDYTDPNAGINLNEGNTPQTRTVEYVCEQDTMTITMPDYGDLLFNRVDKILPTPIPTPGSPDNPNP